MLILCLRYSSIGSFNPPFGRPSCRQQERLPCGDRDNRPAHTQYNHARTVRPISFVAVRVRNDSTRLIFLRQVPPPGPKLGKIIDSLDGHHFVCFF